MLNLVTGVPGASKTAYVVTQLYDIERKNKVNLVKNILIFKHNQPFFDKYKDDFQYYENEVGSAHELKIVLEVLPDDYFLMLGQDFDDLRPDDYYFRSVRYNEIIERIRERGESEQFTFFQPVRTIYSNIKALKIDYARALTYDWRTCPDGSIIVIDEVQLVEPYSDMKDKTNPIIQELTIHRHRGFDFWFITQSPSYMHPTIKELISCHLHITRPYWRTPKIYQFGSLRAYPNTLINKLNCESKFNFTPKDFVFKLYKSTSIDTSKKRFPKGLFGFGAFILFALMIFFYGISGGSGFLGHFFGSEPKKEAVPSSADSKSSHTPSDAATQQNDTLSLECRKSVNVEKPECVQWFNDLSKNKTSVQENGTITQTVPYDSNNPYDFHPVATIQVLDTPRLSGCAKKPNGELVGIDQQGNIMPKIKQSDCKKWLNGERLFDYTKAPVQAENNANFNSQVGNQSSIQQTTKQHISQEVEQANNYVEPQLQAKTINGANTL